MAPIIAAEAGKPTRARAPGEGMGKEQASKEPETRNQEQAQDTNSFLTQFKGRRESECVWAAAKPRWSSLWRKLTWEDTLIELEIWIKWKFYKRKNAL